MDGRCVQGRNIYDELALIQTYLATSHSYRRSGSCDELPTTVTWTG